MQDCILNSAYRLSQSLVIALQCLNPLPKPHLHLQNLSCAIKSAMVRKFFIFAWYALLYWLFSLKYSSLVFIMAWAAVLLMVAPAFDAAPGPFLRAVVIS